MLGHLQRAGHEVVPDGRARVVLVNTCGFIDKAKEESVEAILEAVERKRRGEIDRVIVAGCMVQKYGRELADEIPEVDVFLGLDELERAPEAAAGLPTLPRFTEKPLATRLYDEAAPRVLSRRRGYAYLKVGEGCDNPCTFCTIPQMRGRQRSRTIDSLVAEARALEAQGITELVLISQDTTRYGEDLGMSRQGLARLVEALLGGTTVPWIRFLYAYPKTLDDSILHLMAREPAVPAVRGHPAAARVAIGSVADAPRRRPRLVPGDDPEDARDRSGHRDPDDLHRRVPGRRGGRVPGAVRVRPRGRARQRGGLHLLPGARLRLGAPRRPGPGGGEGPAPRLPPVAAAAHRAPEEPGPGRTDPGGDRRRAVRGDRPAPGGARPVPGPRDRRPSARQRRGGPGRPARRDRVASASPKPSSTTWSARSSDRRHGFVHHGDGYCTSSETSSGRPTCPGAGSRRSGTSTVCTGVTGGSWRPSSPARRRRGGLRSRSRSSRTRCPSSARIAPRAASRPSTRRRRRSKRSGSRTCS